MTKKKRNVIIIVAVVLVVAIALSLSLGLTLGRKNDGWQSALAIGEEVNFSVLPAGKEILSTSVTIDDLSPEYRAKLLAFTDTAEGEWLSDNIFRKREQELHLVAFSEAEAIEILQSKAWSQERFNAVKEGITEKNGIFTALNTDWGAQSAYRSDVLGIGHTHDVTLEKLTDKFTKYHTVKYFGGRKRLNDGEILVHKWVYYSIYASLNELSIDKFKVEEILDSEETIAKHMILKNCASNLYGADGMALEYYGIIPEGLESEIEITLNSESGDRAQTYKIVGYYSSPYPENDLTKLSVTAEIDNSSLMMPVKITSDSPDYDMLDWSWWSMERMVYCK